MARKQLPPRLVEGAGNNWYVAFSDGGRSQRTSLRTTDLQVAQARFQGWLKAREEDAIASQSSTFASAFKLYIQQHAERRTTSPETLEFVGVQLNWFFGSMNLEDIVAKDIHAYTKKRLAGVREVGRSGELIVKRAVSQGTVRKELAIMRAVFNFMVKRVEPKELRVDPRHLCYIELPARPPARNRVLSEKEIDTVRDAIRPVAGERMDRISRYLWLLMETGARSMALRSLTWDQVDLKHNIIHLNPWGRQQTTKRRPTIPISDDLAPILARAKEEATGIYVLDHAGQIRKSMERFCERHHLADVTAHTFRHTLATRMAQAGVSMPEIAAMLGDSIVTVEKNYWHLSPQFLRGALAKLKAA